MVTPATTPSESVKRDPGAIAGYCCPRCQGAKFRTVYTRHRPGSTVRVRKCKGCGHRIRTKEVVVSYSS